MSPDQGARRSSSVFQALVRVTGAGQERQHSDRSPKVTNDNPQADHPLNKFLAT